MRVKVFETTDSTQAQAMNEFLKNPNVTVREIRTAAAGASSNGAFGSWHYVTIMYTYHGEEQS